MLGNEWDLKMHVRNLGYTLLLQIGGLKITFYRRLRNFIATVSACIFLMKDDTHNWVSALENTRGLHSWAPIGMGKGGTCPPLGEETGKLRGSCLKWTAARTVAVKLISSTMDACFGRNYKILQQ